MWGVRDNGRPLENTIWMAPQGPGRGRPSKGPSALLGLPRGKGRCDAVSVFCRDCLLKGPLQGATLSPAGFGFLALE